MSELNFASTSQAIPFPETCAACKASADAVVTYGTPIWGWNGACRSHVIPLGTADSKTVERAA